MAAETKTPISHAEDSSQLGEEILRWLDEASPIVRASPWGKFLSAGGVNAWEVLYSPLYLSLLQFIRGDSPEASRAAWGKRLARQLRLWGYQAKVELRKRAAVRKSDPLCGTEVLFWPREPTHIKAQLPVANALRKQGRRASFVACQPHILQALKAQGVAATFAPALWYDEKRHARKTGQQMARCLASIGNVTLPPLGSPTRACVVVPLGRVRSGQLFARGPCGRDECAWNRQSAQARGISGGVRYYA